MSAASTIMTTTTTTTTTTTMMSQMRKQPEPPISPAAGEDGSNSLTNHSAARPKARSKGSKKPSNRLDEALDLEEKEIDEDLKGMPGWIMDLMQFQPTLNIMTIGDVSHGKSTLMWGLCGEKTGRDSREVKRNMTIKLGYTSCKIFKCINCHLSANICYFSGKSTLTLQKVKCPKCGQKAPFVRLVRHVSFVDCPGHAEYMGTMISAACVADGAVMVIDASRPFPGKQTVQHTSAAHLLGVLTRSSSASATDNKEAESDAMGAVGALGALDAMDAVETGQEAGANNLDSERIKVIVAQNKIDLINKQKACNNIDEIRRFFNSYNPYLSQTTPIIPISAQSRLNLDALCRVMVKKYPPFSPRLRHLPPPSQAIPRPPVASVVSAGPLGPSGTEMKRVGAVPSVGRMDASVGSIGSIGACGGLEINIIRSFDVNRPCVLNSIEDVEKKLRGGVLGGVIINGALSVGDVVCIRPGIVTTRPSGAGGKRNGGGKTRISVAEKVRMLLKPRFEFQAIEAKVTGLKCGEKVLKSAFPGANVGVMLNIDPCLTKSDERAGDVICGVAGVEQKALPVFNVFVMSYVLLRPYDRIDLQLLEQVKVNVGASKVNGYIVERKVRLDKKNARNGGNEEREGVMIVLERPICARIASKVTLTRKMKSEWRLAAGGVIFSVRECCPARNKK